jgi:hypothetical protein
VTENSADRAANIARLRREQRRETIRIVLAAIVAGAVLVGVAIAVGGYLTP